MLNIYHARGTRSFRVIWLCEELAIPYDITPVDFSPAYRASPEWRRMNPVGKVPAMTDGEFTMFESGAMVQYVLDNYGDNRLEPTRMTPEHGLYLQWSWFAEATFSRPLGEIVNHKRAFPESSIPAVIKEMQERARLCVQALDGALNDKEYLVGDEFSAADIMVGYSLRAYRRLVDEDLPTNVSRYWQRLTGRPAYQATVAADAAT